MTREQQAYNKIIRLKEENNRLRANIDNIFKQKERLNFQYMDLPMCDARLQGKEMKKLEKQYNQYKKEIVKNDNEISRLVIKYGLRA